MYSIDISGDAMQRLNNIAHLGWHPTQMRALRNKGWAGEGCMFLPIRKVHDQEFEGPVYNVSVDQDESYLTPHGIAHNCLSDKHHFGVEATAEELMSYEHNPVYGQVMAWYNQHRPEFEPTEIAKHEAEYYRALIPQVRAFRKEVMGTEKLSALLTTQQIAKLTEAMK